MVQDSMGSDTKRKAGQGKAGAWHGFWWAGGPVMQARCLVGLHVLSLEARWPRAIEAAQ